jgi:hypothetical protein
MKRSFLGAFFLAAGFLFALGGVARAEVILQYFQMPWRALTQKMPELAEAGYSAMWLPPPTKASGGLSVGYDLWDPFDLGGKLQRGTVRTFYGTEAELHEMVETAHRFGIRVYFDNIMNHRAFDVPGYNETTPIDIYPGMRPEDFHLRVTEDGFYRKWDNTRDWNDEWQVMHLGLSDLIDIAHESGGGGWNNNFGPFEGSSHPGITLVRHPENPEYYSYRVGASGTSHAAMDGEYVGFGPDNGITEQYIADNEWFYREDVNAYLIRAVRWLMDRTHADGLRLDAVKHVPAYFFGAFGVDDSQVGYVGGMQRQFNLTRGFNDWDNLRDTVFDTEKPRNDAMVFGEHLGAPPGFGGYISAGMRLKDAPLRDHLNGILGSPWGDLSGMDQTGFSGHPDFNGAGHAVGVQFPHSHDSDYASARELQYAYIMTRAGLPIVYTDGNFKAGTLQDAGGAFPRHANTAFLGQFNDPRLPNLAYIHEHFARGYQYPRFADNDVVAYARVDKRDEGWGVNNDMDDRSGAVMFFMMNDNYADGQSRSINPVFGHTSGVDDAWLMNYSTYGGNFYVWASQIANGEVIIPPGGYFAFSWRSPEPSALWTGATGSALEILQNGQYPGSVSYIRRDGSAGDEGFNPYGLQYRGFSSQAEADLEANRFRYRMTVPRVTSGTNLTFRAHIDGSANNVLMKLNGGVDLNHHLSMGASNWGNRDRAPGLANDTFLGWEDTAFVKRIWPEKFAAVDSNRNKIASGGAETYVFTVGQAGFTINESTAVNDFSSANDTHEWVYHDPAAMQDGTRSENAQFWPPPADTANAKLYLGIKTPKWPGSELHFYYTTDGQSWPEGAGGIPANNATKVIAGAWKGDGDGSTDWWEVIVPPMASGTVVRYKVGVARRQGADENGWDVAFPDHPDEVARKYNMMGVWEIPGFNAETIEYFLHNDYQQVDGNPVYTTGLREGMNFIQARAFLGRDGEAPIYNTFKQTFYLDLERPTGEVTFPVDNEELPGQEYGVVVRTDRTVTDVWFNVLDSEAANDDGQTGVLNGNGTNELGQTSWVQAQEMTVPSLDIDSAFEREWRFTYRNIPAAGDATIRVRLLELSSSTNFTLTDEAGHFTTLEREVRTRGPAQRLFVAWPQNDGDTVGEGYGMKAYFSRALADGTTFEQLRDRFTILINGEAQGKDQYGITYEETDEYHALTFDLPNLYNGDPDFLHEIEVRHTDGGLTLIGTRNVKAQPVPIPPRLTITRPEQFDSNGRQTVLVLPDVPDPEPEDREYTILVSAAPEYQHVWIEFDGDRGQADYVSGPETNGSDVVWTFNWTNMTAGTFVFTAYGNTNAPDTSAFANSSLRSIPVVLRQLVEVDDTGDSDNDGVPDDMEVTQTPLPDTDSDFWTDGQVHVWRFTGRTDPLMPLTDGGGLPDGLQLGLRSPIFEAATDRTVDTNGDGFRNFISDLDPPMFNTKPDSNWHPDFREFAGRTDQITGSMTDPVKPDTDDDGLRDSEEDLNRNGRVDIGLLGAGGKVESILEWPNIPTVYNTSQVDAGRLPANARFLETDPNSGDTIGDGLLDGQSDENRNGRVDMYLLLENDDLVELDYTDWNGSYFQFNLMPNNTNLIYWDNQNTPDWHDEGQTYAPIRSRAVDYAALLAAYNREGTGTAQTGGWPKLLITETDPLRIDTIGDGLPDGWKVRYGLDPLDDGVYNWRTGEAGDPLNGPDGDLTGDGVTNMDHFLNGTDPRVDVEYVPPAGSIVVGQGDALGEVNGVPRFREFIDWTWEDLLALDAYHGAGNNHRGGDIYRAWDGWDESRDLVAFYARDGGGAAQGGDNRFYFRIDIHDLQALAEQGNVDYYIAVNFGDMGNPSGERVLPDEVDTLTDMRWKVVVAIYESGLGTVYVDYDPVNNTTVFGEDLIGFGGVESRGEYYLGAYFNAELDAIEIAIDRQALLDAGWGGFDPGLLNYQVYSVKSGTQNVPQGPGDIGGRSDIRDSILNDWIAEDYWNAQAGLQGAGSVMPQWIPGNSQPGRVKVALVVHGNDAIRPGSYMQDRINDNAGAGYYRPLDAHAVYQQPLNLHITPTLASAIQWAKGDPVVNEPWRDGPAFNQRIRELVETNVVHLLASTFSDHMLPYFTPEFNRDNVALASEYLEGFYGVQFNTNTAVFWTPERLLDADVLDKIKDMGFRYTLVDQNQHIWHWVGRTPALSDDGYRINRFHGVGTFAINNAINDFRYSVHDSGAPMQLRQIFNRKARSGTQDQVVIMLFHWEEFLNIENADAYDALVRWIANRPWVEMVALEDITRGEIDLTGDGTGDAYWELDRGSDPALAKMANNYIQFATRGNYDNWFVGEPGYREGLEGKLFEVRPGVDMPAAYGMLYSGGVVSNTWDLVRQINDEFIRDLARPVMHASVFQTAFHDQPSVDLRKFSTGDYLFPDTEAVVRPLATFAEIAQSQTRMAAIYTHVEQWAAAAAGMSTTMVVQVDIDLDGENEYLLGNDHVLGVFERIGGRMVLGFVRNPANGQVLQMVGNMASYAGSASEWEGIANVDGDNVGAHRTSGFKDWWDGSQSYVNEMYTVTPVANGWQLVSSDNKITKTITLAPGANAFAATYAVTGGDPLYIRHGLSPHLDHLLRHGQSGLTDRLAIDAATVQLATDTFEVAAFIDTAANVAVNVTAADGPYDTLGMRNQAQTQQVELEGSGTFSFALGFEILAADPLNDGVPYTWLEDAGYPDPGSVDVNATLAANGVNSLKQAYIAGLDPNDADAFFLVDGDMMPVEAEESGILLRWPSVANRVYFIYRSSDLLAPDSGFVAIESHVPATPPENTYPDTNATVNAVYYYRLGVALEE